MEILSPAGSLEAAKAAILGGCDAIYLGAKTFSARAGAQNFDFDQLKEVIALAHGENVRVHMAINTLISDKEMQEALELACTAYHLGIDALIIQDLGLAKLVHQTLPDMPIHASTQMTVHTLEGVKKVAQMGFSRAILARELSLKEIEYIAKNAPIEVECFIHGALCMSVSGQCFLSAAIGGRSGNRGRCAGTCRLPFSKNGKKGRYDLSLKDLCAIEQIRALEKMGVVSVKIEGRLKRADYVYQVTRSCYEAMENKPVDKALLADLFSRSGFTEGYVFGKITNDMFGVRSESDVKNTRTTTLQMTRVKRHPIGICFDLKETATLTMSDGKHTACVSAPAAVAENKPLSQERIAAALSKLGDTPFAANDIRIDCDGIHTLPVSGINALRRDAAEQLLALRQASGREKVQAPILNCTPQKHEPSLLRGRFETVQQMGGLADELDYVSLPLQQVYRHADSLQNIKDKLIIELPRMCFDNENATFEMAAKLKEAGFVYFEAQNIAQVPIATHGGFSLNIYNTFSAQSLKEMGLSRVTLSQELHHRQIADIGCDDTAMVAYGYMPVMVMRACPNKGAKGCADCGRHPYLTDRYGKQFEIFCQKGWAFLLNSAPLYMGDKKQWCKTHELILFFTTESADRAKEVVRLFKQGEPFDQEFTRGLYGRGVQNE